MVHFSDILMVLKDPRLKITSQADELFYGVYEKVSLISKIIFRKFLRQFKSKTA